MKSMKQVIYIMPLAVLLAASCQKNDLTEDSVNGKSEHYKTLTVGVDDDE